MIPHFAKVQRANRPLLIRGSFSGAELRSIVDSLDPRGLFLNIMVQDRAGMDVLRPIVGM
jgi:hypothetical protein